MSSRQLFKTNPIPCILNNKPYIGANVYNVYRSDQSTLEDREVLHSVASCSQTDATQLVDGAQSALNEWKKSSISDRVHILLKTAEIIRQNLNEFTAVSTRETCVSPGFAIIDQSLLACSQLEALAKYLKEGGLAPKQLPVNNEGAQRYIFKEPYGVVLGIAPWNAPFYLGLRAVLYPIFCGNTAVLKTSEYAPQVQNMVASCLYEAGLPGNVLNVAHIAPHDASSVTEALIAHPAVRKVNFTGSTVVGAKIAQTAAKYLKPTCMELGGKAPMIVMEDADLDLAANHLVFGGFLNSNQICMSVNNIYVHANVEQQLKDKVKLLFKENSDILTASLDSSAIRGLFSHSSGQKIKALYEDAVSQGAHVVAGTPKFDGALVQPVVLSNVQSHMRIFHEETFGPVLSTITFDNVEDAIAQINTSAYGLSSCIYSRNIEKALKIAKSLDISMVQINAHSVHDDPEMPHGGWKNSGWGRLSGLDFAIGEFTQSKCICVHPPHQLPLTIM